jgi:hypothetical protein
MSEAIRRAHAVPPAIARQSGRPEKHP